MLATVSSIEISHWRAFYALEQKEIEEAGNPSTHPTDAEIEDEITFGEGV